MMRLGFALCFGAVIVLGVAACGPTPETTAAPTPRPSVIPTSTPLPTATPLPTPTPQPVLGSTWARSTDGMIMVYVPAGQFNMGSVDADPDARDDEKPQHPVELDAFWIDQTEVTVAMFRAFVRASGYRTTAEQEGWGYAWVDVAGKPEWQKVSGADWQHPSGPGSVALDDHPVVQVSWDDAMAYCTWAGARLPTEAEWEYAARGPQGLLYPWGNAFDGTLLNYCDANCPYEHRDNRYDDQHARPAPVGLYLSGASWCGALDMAGNVWEWVADWYDAGYYARSSPHNPEGPGASDARAMRGGAWLDNYRWTRCAFRNSYSPKGRNDHVGLRCVVPAR